ncbi:MAG: choice-of-anchor B domain-containing protein [Flavobacteriaceae bacterium]|jgi:choice-of-anchor B domain-containing protein|uniref:choice-of-anchor B family protein n=1 Tax=Candidatus Marifrigoribacter sp. Uisw_064 TaxID=3230970 RepID=UPI003AEA7E22
MKKLLYLLLIAPFFITAQTPCSGGMAGAYPCNNMDLLSNVPVSSMGGSGIGNDSWGWTSGSGTEYVLMGMSNGTAFLDISDPVNPVYLGILPTHTSSSSWRDIKVYSNHAFIVSEASGHGMQVFDLTRLTSVSSPPVTFTEDAHLSSFGSAHNIAINEGSGYAYVIGAGSFSGGPIFINIQDPLNPIVEGGYSGDGYTHDAQIVMYHGSDTEHVGKEILIASNEDTVTIVDVSDKSNPIQLSRSTYSGDRYTHQGWLTFDHDHYIFNDELDESNIGHNTRTRLMDVSNLDSPVLIGFYDGPSSAIDHNGYTKGNRYYMANYRAGVRVLDISNIATPSSISEVSFFDTYPSNNNASFNAVWNVYPYFSSGVLVVSDIENGLFLIKDPNYDAIPPTAVCQNITVTLDATGNATITAAQVDGGSTDNVLIFDRSIDIASFTCSDIGPNNVELTVLDGNENKAACIAIVTVQAAITTYNGTWSNGTPNAGSNAVFASSYNTSSGSIEACECEIGSSSTVTVGAGEYLDIQRNILVDGTLDVQHEGSVVQRDDASLATNGGTIIVRKLTPSLGPKGFMILGNPMTGETREGVYGGGRQVLNHRTDLFIPNGAVGGPTENFVDDNNNNWEIHSGALVDAAGYLVKPQAPGNPPVGGQFPLDYTLGTLNNGLVTYDLLFNGTRLNSPNMLGNPYASAIDLDVFLPENPLIDAVYYWQHITAPADTFPGFNQLNFNLGDISVYNQGSGGVEAQNGGGVPTQFMASGQGFGVKALGLGQAIFNNSMRVTTPNTDYRQSNSDRQRIWLSLKSEAYDYISSNMLVAFTEGATDGFEGIYDSRRFDTPISLFSVLNTEEELAIQGRTAFNEDQEVQLGFSTMVEEVTSYSISINQIEGEEISNATVYLHDKVLDVITNLSEENYEFTSNAMYNTDRFELTFKGSILGTSESLENIAVYPNPTQNYIQIDAKTNTVLSATIFDVRGRQIGTYNFNDGDAIQIDISGFETAMYFIEINTNSGTITKRIIKK